MTLPTVKIVQDQLPNPDWVAVRTPSGKLLNAYEMYVEAEVDAEILTVHFQKNTMRIRFSWTGWDKQIETIVRDVSAQPFFFRYIVEPRW